MQDFDEDGALPEHAILYVWYEEEEMGNRL
jgi:hypothetical protein